MKFYEVKFTLTPCTEVASDILIALLGEVGYEAFESNSEGVLAWIIHSKYSQKDINSVLESFPLPDITITHTACEAPDENWNHIWEQEGFKPIIIKENVVSNEQGSKALIVIHDTRHTDVPDAHYDIKINPCQAFGTGSHETTRMILRQLLEIPMQERHVIDAGTGTGILTIMCKMLGASHVLAYDIDEWSVRNTKENLVLNDTTTGVNVLLGDSSVLLSANVCTSCNENIDVFKPTLLIANINRNILMADMHRFNKCLPAGGELLLSGFYFDDIPSLLTESAKYGFRPIVQKEDNNWALLLLKKEKSQQ